VPPQAKVWRFALPLLAHHWSVDVRNSANHPHQDQRMNSYELLIYQLKVIESKSYTGALD